MSNEKCSICDVVLNDDNHYGTEEYPLCRYHHGKFNELLYLLVMGEVKIEDEIDRMKA